MKRAALLFLVFVMIFTIAACGGKQQPAQTTAPSQTDPTTKPIETTLPPETTQPPETTKPAEVPLTQDDFGSFDGTITGYVSLIMYQPNDGDFGKAQGACTDGTYYYVILENVNVTEPGGYSQNSHYAKIVKIDITTLQTVLISEPLLIDHGNDVTYNPNTGMLVVSNNTPNYKSLSFVDTETLELVKIVEDNELGMYGIDYSTTRDQYVVGISGGYDFAILDNDLNVVKTFTGKRTGWTKQGITCDDNFIYFLTYKRNAIVVYDWDGNYIRTIQLKGIINEPESLFILNEKIHIVTYYGGYMGAQIYEANFIGN